MKGISVVGKEKERFIPPSEESSSSDSDTDIIQIHRILVLAVIQIQRKKTIPSLGREKTGRFLCQKMRNC